MNSTPQVSYSCAEQYMMAGKARLFGDDDALAQIMATDSPSAHKKLGRGVRGYDTDTWNAHKKSIVMRGSYEKFRQNPLMARHLLDTREKVLYTYNISMYSWGTHFKTTPVTTLYTWRYLSLLMVLIFYGSKNLHTISTRISWVRHNYSRSGHLLRKRAIRRAG